MALIAEIVEPAGEGRRATSVRAVTDVELAKLQNANTQAEIITPHRFGIFPPLQTEVEMFDSKYHHSNR